MSEFYIKMLEVSGPNNLDSWTVIARPISTKLVCLRHGPTTIAAITIHFLAGTLFAGQIGDVLTFITANLGYCIQRYDVELCSERVWVEIPTADGISMLTGNHYFSPYTPNPEVIIAYFHHLENTLSTKNTHLILLWDFSASGFNCGSGIPLPKFLYYPKLKGDAMYTSTCLLGLRQFIEPFDSLKLLDLVSANCADLKSVPADSGLVSPDTHHPLWVMTYCFLS
jgi:hypothetical protein